MKKEIIEKIVNYTIDENKPNNLAKYLNDFSFHDGKLIVIAFGKASWLMAWQASQSLKKKIDVGIVITKYKYSLGPIANFEVYEAGHPIVDENSLQATSRVLEVTKNLSSNDDVIVLVSGGGSALLEKPICSLEQLRKLNQQLVNSNKPIEEINKIRKQYSLVKGGKLANHIYPAHIYNFILSDVVSNDLASIASGPTINDDLNNITSYTIGSCKLLAQSCQDICQKLGYQTMIVDDQISCDANKMSKYLSYYIDNYQNAKQSMAFIFAGEITLEVKGNGLGGRNQHLAALAVDLLKDSVDTTLICVGSDGSDGPTDAAGGYCDSNSYQKCLENNIDYHAYLNNSDSYHLLEKMDQLIITGPTNTNVNDLYLLLIQRN